VGNGKKASMTSLAFVTAPVITKAIKERNMERGPLNFF